MFLSCIAIFYKIWFKWTCLILSQKVGSQDFCASGLPSEDICIHLSHIGLFPNEVKICSFSFAWTIFTSWREMLEQPGQKCEASDPILCAKHKHVRAKSKLVWGHTKFMDLNKLVLNEQIEILKLYLRTWRTFWIYNSSKPDSRWPSQLSSLSKHDITGFNSANFRVRFGGVVALLSIVSSTDLESNTFCNIFP